MRLLCLALLLLSACRVERYDGDAVRDTLAAVVPPMPEPDTLRAPAPAALAGDTASVLPDSTAAPAPRLPSPAAGPATGPSGLLIPVQGIGPADLADTFTDARSENRRHDAIDILAPRGTPVVAATEGRILRLFTSDKGGLTIYQMGPDERTVYYYAHLDAYAPGLAAGQRVTRGQVLGTVGDTGNAVPGNTHLHFAIWTVEDPANFWDGVNLNPYPLLR